MGRPAKYKQYIREYFTVKTKNNKIVYTCNFCNGKYAKNFHRMAKHLLKCPKSMLSNSQRNAIKRCFSRETEPTEVVELNECPQSSSSGIIKYIHEDKSNRPGSLSPSNLQVLMETKEEIKNFSCTDIVAKSQLSASASASTITIVDMDMDMNDVQCCSKSINDANNTLTNFVDRIVTEEQDAIWALLARACYATGTPLSFTENKYWQKAFKALRPSFTLPSRFVLSSRLLDNEYLKIKESVTLELASASYLSVQLDGWSNVRCEPIINVVLTTPRPIVYKIIDTQEKKHTAEYMADIIQEVFSEIGVDRIVSVITDNAKNMEKARNIVLEKYPDRSISLYGCVAHIFNLFIKDVCKLEPFLKIEELARKIIRKIKYSHDNIDQFKNYQKEYNTGRTLKLPVATRWASIVYCIRSLIENIQPLQRIAISPKANLPEDLKDNILDNKNFWTTLQYLHAITSPVAKWIKILESSHCRINYVIPSFVDIKKQIIEKTVDSTYERFKLYADQILDLLEHRKQMAVKDIHKAAHLLDPRSKGKCLSPCECVDAMEFIEKLSKCFLQESEQGNVIAELAMYRNSTGLWKKPFVQSSLNLRTDKTQISSLTWWRGICGSTSLSKVATAILESPSTTACTERSFSTSAFIHSNRRNRLKNKTVAKLSYIKSNLSLQNSTYDYEDDNENILKLQDDVDDVDIAEDNISVDESETNEDSDMEVEEAFILHVVDEDQ
ncbi:hypothetical protein Zmor_003318 [Zophobas morio]|uniref:DUF659 domain-containing protein n=1 Tax=Zophobas morio TaxID=2755281 RepID=A0AA38HP47_9CUCU|nr:hypothetical protein Zmor_003318 [Zophobas morio]